MILKAESKAKTEPDNFPNKNLTIHCNVLNQRVIPPQSRECYLLPCQCPISMEMAEGVFFFGPDQQTGVQISSGNIDIIRLVIRTMISRRYSPELQIKSPHSRHPR